MQTVLFWVVVAAVVLVAYLIRYAIRKGANAASDIVVNAYKRKKNEENAQQSEKLSDRYK